MEAHRLGRQVSMPHPPWGECAEKRSETCVIVNSEGEALAVLPQTPKSPTWQQAVQEATTLMANSRSECGKDPNVEHRRGPYATVAGGWSYGGGQPVRRSTLVRVQT